MIAYIYRTKRRLNGKLISSRTWRARLKLNGDIKARDVSLGVSDKQVAEQKLRDIIRDHERAGTSSVVNLTITLAPVILSTPQISVSKTNFTFLLSGPVGSNYVLQVSTNLLNWNPVSTSTIPVSGSITLSNAISGYKQGFFRVHLQ